MTRFLLHNFALVFGLCASAQALDNLALTGTAGGSTIGFGTAYADGNDGNRNGNYNAGSVFHTIDPDPAAYWEVNLGGVKNLDHVRIFNRTDAIQGSVANFRIQAFDGATKVFDNSFLPAISTDANSSKAWGTNALRGVQANRVRLERINMTSPNVRFITFAEFEVWGSAAPLTPRIPNGTITASPAGAGSAAGDGADGDINGNFFAPGFPVYQSSAAGVGQFWEMDLAADYQVTHVLLFNRTDAATTTNAKVSLRNAGNAEVWSTNVNLSVLAATPHAYGFELPVNVAGRKLRIETLGAEILAFSEIEAFGTLATPTPPTVINGTATNIAGSSATVGGTVTSQGSAIPNVTVYYGPADGGTDTGAWAGSQALGPKTQNVPFTTTLSGLTPSTQYFFRCFAQNTVGSDWADSAVTFTTPTVMVPALAVGPANGITGYTARFEGRVTDTGNDPPTVTLFWGTTNGGTNPATWQNSTALGPQSAAFGAFLNNLVPATSYHFAVRATNGAGTAWTTPGTFTTGTKQPIVINEIHFEPDDKTKPLEFIELHNPTTTAVNLAGWKIVSGADYTFAAGASIPAGGYVVVAQNPAAFMQKFGFTPLGPWLGQLKNSGEEIELRDHLNQVVDDVTYGVGFPWPTMAAGGASSAELIHPGLDSDVGGNWRSSTALPTPGAANSVRSIVAAPAVRQVTHTPEIPAAAQAVTITAKITDSDGMGAVTLQYQPVNPGAYIRFTDAAYATTWTNVPMLDDGTNGDAIPADGIYTAVLPPAVQTHRRLVRYRIVATDAFGVSATVPYPDDEQPNFAYFVHSGVPAWSGAVLPGGAAPRGTVQNYPATLLNSLQTWHLIANSTDVDNSQFNSGFDGVKFRATIVYEGKVYDHILFRNRGIGSTYVSGKNKWALYFNRARNIRVRDNWGNYYKESWNSFPIEGASSPWCSVHRGMAGVEEAITYRIYELASQPSLRTHYMHWRVVRNASESGPTQYDGDLWGLYLGLEPTEGNFLDERGLPDGNLYAIEGGGGDKKHQGATQVTDGSDWNNFRNGANQGGQTLQWYRDNLDLDALYTFHALNRFIGNVDIRGGDNFRFYHRPTDNRWTIIPYDLDMMILPAHHWGTNIDGVSFAGVPDQIRAISRHPTLALEFRNRARELLDLLGSDGTANGGQVGQLIDEYAQIVNPTGAALTWADVDEALWCNHPRTQGGGGNSGYTSHKNNFYRTPYNDFRGNLNGTTTTNWTRTLPDPDGNGYSDFEGLMNWLRNYTTNTWPGGTWLRSNGNQLGYGWKYLEWESLYGGFGNVNAQPGAPDLAFPNTPVITYSGPAGYPVNALDFTSSDFSPSGSGGTTFAAMQWRLGEIYAPGIPGYVAGEPRIYEIENVWTSAELTTFNATVHAPLNVVRPARTYRARVRHKDANGRWSHWSAPVQFVASSVDLTVWQQGLRITELNYNPAPATPAEFAAGYGSDDFEFIELKNIGATPLDLTGVRFTKGVDFNFPDGYQLAPGAFALVVKNVTAFQLRYGHSHDSQIVGNYGTDNFSNSGEEVKLSYGAGAEIHSFIYSDTLPWPADADGAGPTLVLKAPHTAPSQTPAMNWRPSLAVGGSPGADEGTIYPAWKTSYGIANDLADDDGDGLTALLEYALGNDPGVNSRANLPVVTRAADGTLHITVTQALAADDVTFTIETSTDLTAWSLANATLSNATTVAGRQTLTFTLPPSIPADPRRFIRVKFRVL